MTKSLLVGIVVSVLVVSTGVYIWFLWLPQQERASFENHYLNIAKRLNSAESKTEVLSWFERDYNFTELSYWVHEKLEFVPFDETFERHTDPSEILESGKGRCEEFSILYVAASLAHGYPNRIIVAVDISNPVNLIGQHVWAEVKLDNRWVHVDPSEKRWNETSMYQAWEWGKRIGSEIAIYAFEHERFEEVTLKYALSDRVEKDSQLADWQISLISSVIGASIPLVFVVFREWHQDKKTKKKIRAVMIAELSLARENVREALSQGRQEGNRVLLSYERPVRGSFPLDTTYYDDFDIEILAKSVDISTLRLLQETYKMIYRYNNSFSRVIGGLWISVSFSKELIQQIEETIKALGG